MKLISFAASLFLLMVFSIQAAEPTVTAIEAAAPLQMTTITSDASVLVVTSSAFEKGSWTAQVFLSGTHGFDDGDIYVIHAGVGYHLLDDLSIHLDFVGGYTFEDERQIDPNATIGFDLLLRLQIFQGAGWSIFVEGGAGMVWFRDGFPPGGTHQNFTPQLGAGFTCPFIDQSRLLLGIRWHHISNASKTGEDRNPGYDGIMAYAGVMIPF